MTDFEVGKLYYLESLMFLHIMKYTGGPSKDSIFIFSTNLQLPTEGSERFNVEGTSFEKAELLTLKSFPLKKLFRTIFTRVFS